MEERAADEAGAVHVNATEPVAAAATSPCAAATSSMAPATSLVPAGPTSPGAPSKSPAAPATSSVAPGTSPGPAATSLGAPATSSFGAATSSFGAATSLGGAAGPKKKRRLADLSQEEIEAIVALRGKMAQAAVGRRYGLEQTDVSQIQRLQRARAPRPEDRRAPRVKDVEVVLPIVYGTISFWLGKKADEFHSHRWTVFVRSPRHVDLSAVVRRVAFRLHPSFAAPVRTVEGPGPFALTETGWGEFEIGITLTLHADAGERPVELFHGLKLYPEEEGSQPSSTKKPVVVENYDELVFTEPLDTFFQRVRNNPAVHLYGSNSALTAAAPEEDEKPTKGERGDAKAHPLSQWFGNFSDADELARLSVARQQVASLIAKLEQDYAAAEAECQRLRVAMS